MDSLFAAIMLVFDMTETRYTKGQRILFMQGGDYEEQPEQLCVVLNDFCLEDALKPLLTDDKRIKRGFMRRLSDNASRFTYAGVSENQVVEFLIEGGYLREIRYEMEYTDNLLHGYTTDDIPTRDSSVSPLGSTSILVTNTRTIADITPE